MTNPTITIHPDGQGTLTIDGQPPFTINTGHPDTTQQLLTSIATTRTSGPIDITIDGHTTTFDPNNQHAHTQPATPAPTLAAAPDVTHAQSQPPEPTDTTTYLAAPPSHHTDTGNNLGLNDLFHNTDSVLATPQTLTQLPDRIITLANLKGGTGKTPLAVVLAQALDTLAGHDDIVIVELNPRGTLSSRAPRHAANTIIDLAAACHRDSFATQPRDLDPYLSWQPGGWATIVCPPSIINEGHGLITPVTADDLDRITTALATRFHVIIIDTGNNDLDEAWQHAITIADRIIIPIQWDPDTLTLTQNMVRDMDQLGHGNLKTRILWVGTHAPIDRPKRAMKKSFSQALTQSGWTVHNLPADRHLATDTTITWTKLARRTRRAATTIATALLTN